MATLIGIETTRYSTFMKRVLSEFNNNVLIQINTDSYSTSDIKKYSGQDIPTLIETWCTNKNIKQTLFFNLQQNDEELFGFWDTPENLWADISVLPFIKEMADEKIIRFHIANQKSSKIITWLKAIFGKFLKKRHNE